MPQGSLSRTEPMLLRNISKKTLSILGAAFIFVLVIFHYNPFYYAIGGQGLENNPLIQSVYNSTFGFESIFVVGLPSRTDRRDGMTLLASLSKIDIEFIDGVRGGDVADNAIPTSRGHERLGDPTIGSWRGHMNAIREVVHRNLSSAIIMEDDVDWDVRIRDQLRDFAVSAQTLTQPLAMSAPGTYADPTYPEARKDVPSVLAEMKLGNLPAVNPSTFSPYGDDWDLLWLGHCGMSFPFSDNPIPKARVVHNDDDTVPEKRYLWSLNHPFSLVDQYPQHTRTVHHSQEGVCSLSYAISQRGAQRLLYEVGLKDVSDGFDILLRFFCEGAKGRRRRMCLTVQPALFNHHRPAGPDSSQSDIGNHGNGWREQSQTDMTRWSARLNADAIIDGSKVFHDQLPNAD